MEKEKRLIDANILESWIDGGIQGAEEANGNAPIVSLYDVLRELDNIPTVDAAEVVRCKDCKHYVDDPYDNGDMMCDCWGEWIFPHDDDFCSCGERKDNG